MRQRVSEAKSLFDALPGLNAGVPEAPCGARVRRLQHP